MWYLAELLFAEASHPDRADYQCESCNVLLRAETSIEANEKALAWGAAHDAEPPIVLRFLGVSRLTRVDEELEDGTDIGGMFYRDTDVWARIEQLIPPTDQLSAIVWEQNKDVPLEDFISPERIAQLKRAFGQED